MNRYLVKNVEEAVEMALRFKSEGRYDWFRGQLSAEWAPQSSMERAIEGGQSQDFLEQRLERFLGWARTESSLNYLAEPVNRDQLFAVLQHYGFPTTYIDFSTDPGVAAFFASDYNKEPPKSGDYSVIYCLNTTDLMRFYDEHITPCDSTKKVNIVSVNVDNLWRLQVQAGHFLSVNHKWYEIYDMDCIVFPWTGYPSFPSRKHIYPEDCSALESLLDKYLKEEEKENSHKKDLSNFLRESNKLTETDAGIFKIFKIHSVGYNTDVFDVLPPKLSSWGEAALRRWLEVPAELFYEAVGHHRLVTLRNEPKAPLPSLQLANGITTAMRCDASLRRRAVRWELQGLPDAKSRERLEMLVRKAWNGMRNLPYADEDIAVACGTLLDLCSQQSSLSCDIGEPHRAFQAGHPDAMEVRFGATGDSGSRGFCSEAQLNKAISQIWLSSLPSNVSGDSPKSALQLCQLPNRVMDFTAFAQLFGRELIPSQLARGESIVYFNPAKLDCFWLP